ncbi:TPA: family 1 glycosylhydrolase, partial [Klebsiella pneumoniae]|nr:family 1 glycosylhydrolase [Klebsiella pneumoniae]
MKGKIIKNCSYLILFITLFFFYQKNVFSLEIGVSTHIDSYSKEPDYYINLVKEIGVTSIRNDYWWSQLEGEKKKFIVSSKLKKSTQLFNNLYDNNLSGLLVLGYGNKLYNNGDYPRTEKDIDDFLDYISWVVIRFKGKVKYYEIWNEWYQGTSMEPFSKNKPTDKQYLNLIKKVRDRIKDLDPAAIVLAGGFNPFDVKQNKWFSGLIDKGFLKYVDGVAIHPYSYYRGSKFKSAYLNISEIDKFYNFYKNKGIDFQIYITEIGVPNGYLINSFSEQ